jgi:hypothetical protein
MLYESLLIRGRYLVGVAGRRPPKPPRDLLREGNEWDESYEATIRAYAVAGIGDGGFWTVVADVAAANPKQCRRHACL